MKLDINTILRPNVRKMKPYSSARNEYKGDASIFLDANENPYNAPYNRYPDPLQWDLKKGISLLKGVAPESIFLGNGSDEPIDLLFRAFCEPRIDNAVSIEPSYGMYQVSAELNDVVFTKVLLDDAFDLDAARLLRACDDNTKLIFLCSPNNPSGNRLNEEEVLKVLRNFRQGLVVIDEAYIDFSSKPSFLTHLQSFERLVVLQTFSKAWGSAAIRLGMAFACPKIIEVLNKIKYPYNINKLTQEHALDLLKKAPQVKAWVAELLQERTRLGEALRQLSIVKQVYPSDANFLLVRVPDATSLYQALVERGIIVRNRNSITLCEGCLRITVGTPAENDALVEALSKF